MMDKKKPLTHKGHVSPPPACFYKDILETIPHLYLSHLSIVLKVFFGGNIILKQLKYNTCICHSTYDTLRCQ